MSGSQNIKKDGLLGYRIILLNCYNDFFKIINQICLFKVKDMNCVFLRIVSHAFLCLKHLCSIYKYEFLMKCNFKKSYKK